jgi:pimeloyl-ACP methyl ester carboxylesterase
MLLGIEPEGYARCCEALARWDVRGQLDGVRLPVLAIAAADDPSTPPVELERIVAEIPGARLAVIDSAAHAANVERADEFNRLIEEHL